MAIAFTVVGVSLIQLVGDYLFTQRTNEDRRIAESFAQNILSDYRSRDAEAVYAAALEFCAQDGSRLLVLDKSGVVQVDSQSSINGSRFYNTEAARVLSGDEASSYGYYDMTDSSADVGGNLLRGLSQKSLTGVYSCALSDGTGIVGAVVYISQIQEIYTSLSEIRFKIILWLVIVAAAVLLLLAFLLRSVTRPIDSLKAGIAKMTAGDFSTRVTVRGHNEFSELAEAFNSMTEQLDLLDKTRSQFVSNASHELKTPLSTIKILIESVLYQEPFDPAMTRDFLTDVNNEIDRLNRIVSDLLTLVNIDSGGMKLNVMEVDIQDLLIEQVRRLSPLARENGIELDCVPGAPQVIPGDPVKLQQVLYNVIDNAIKYTPRGGEVNADISHSGKKVIIRIDDTGIGIPAADLPHIFDRFYRVDKARSRATGGTGLGLSIVKQIVQAHGGSITAESTEGEGTTFIIELPIPQRSEH